jgi:hypothetical protein
VLQSEPLAELKHENGLVTERHRQLVRLVFADGHANGLARQALAPA